MSLQSPFPGVQFLLPELAQARETPSRRLPPRSQPRIVIEPASEALQAIAE
ncbi:hypothetical protein [Phormidium sp. CCY1219]|uniref:hypothetical protein n=1 Tax=Phormidium sp. CCY1219 TaxID=2886104 RepID=UPI002D1EA34C|nr:hypothetical protein [Phormidium sp. CCY1219]MEB3828564.1 hypothetical protein [Phormidium sp. CCY1219]